MWTNLINLMHGIYEVWIIRHSICYWWGFTETWELFIPIDYNVFILGYYQPFVILLDVQFWYYYQTLACLCKCTTLQPRHIYPSGYPFLNILTKNIIFFLSWSGKKNKGKGVKIPWARSAPHPAHPVDL